MRPNLVAHSTLTRVSAAAGALRRRSNGETIVRLVLLATLASVVVLLFQRRERAAAADADAAAAERSRARGCLACG